MMKKLHLSLLLLGLSINASAAINFDETKAEYESLLQKKFILLPHKGTYLLPVSYNGNPQQQEYKELRQNTDFKDRGEFNRNLEAEFQISFLILTNKNVFNTSWNMFLGYTHHAWWQIYNEDWSRPFRETNYEPEIFARKLYDTPLDLGITKLGLIDIGYVHESNGQVQELSRSWDRVFIRGGFLFEHFVAQVSLWYRLPEAESIDDNPDIQDYLGYGDINLVGLGEDGRIEMRLTPGIKNYGVEIGYSSPWKEGLRFYTKIGHGYGLSLIDYNYETNRIAFGFSIADYLRKGK